jgi:tagaturonate epimerase
MLSMLTLHPRTAERSHDLVRFTYSCPCAILWKKFREELSVNTQIIALLNEQGFSLYDSSVRKTASGAEVFVVAKGAEKFVGILGSSDGYTDCALVVENACVFPLNWDNYLKLRSELPIAPAKCNKKASFGMGDRLGLVTAAHLAAVSGLDVFPVVAQQSPRELGKTNRDWHDVLLKAAMGVLESGYAGSYGADADHIKDEDYLRGAAASGYSMYTLDVSDWLGNVAGLSDAEAINKAQSLSETGRAVVAQLTGKTVMVPHEQDYTFCEGELAKSALVYEKSMLECIRLRGIIKSEISDFDLEVSIDEGSRDTTPEDHAFVAGFLHNSGVDFTSLAPKFPGEFQKAVEYSGDVAALATSMRTHGAIARMMGGYRLSLHSGSDKFSVYPLFAEATEGNFHIKTSGTSWLMAVKLVASQDRKLFAELYRLCLDNLAESKKAYHVYITSDIFPAEAPEDVVSFYDKPDVRQLFHISYGVLLDAKKSEIFDVLARNEAEHYKYVAEHIGNHLKLALRG